LAHALAEAHTLSCTYPNSGTNLSKDSNCALSKFGYMVIIIDFGIVGRKTLNYIYKGQLDKSWFASSGHD